MAIFQSPKNIFQRPKFPGNSLKFRERAIFAKFQAPNFENSEPEKMQFHTPSHSIPPLGFVVMFTSHVVEWWQFKNLRARCFVPNPN